MPTMHGHKFGTPVNVVASGFYPFQVEIWAFTGESTTNPNEWLVTFQGIVRKTSGTNQAVPQGSKTEVSEVCIFKTANYPVDTTAPVADIDVDIQYTAHALPVQMVVNIIDPSGATLIANKLRFRATPSTIASVPLGISLVDTQIGTTLNLIGTTEVVVIDPIF